MPNCHSEGRVCQPRGRRASRNCSFLLGTSANSRSLASSRARTHRGKSKIARDFARDDSVRGFFRQPVKAAYRAFFREPEVSRFDPQRRSGDLLLVLRLEWGAVFCFQRLTTISNSLKLRLELRRGSRDVERERATIRCSRIGGMNRPPKFSKSVRLPSRKRATHHTTMLAERAKDITCPEVQIWAGGP